MYSAMRRRWPPARGGAANGVRVPGRLPGAGRRRRIHRHHADGHATGGGRGTRGAHRRRFPSDMEIEGHIMRVGLTIGVGIFPQERRRRHDAGGQRRRRFVPRQGGGARLDPLLRSVDGQADTREARAAAGSAVSGHARRTGAALPAAGDNRRRYHRLRGAGALASSGAWLVPPSTLYPARRGERRYHGARRMGAARRLPRGGVLAAAPEHRHQSVAGAVPARRSAQARAPDSAGGPACRRSGWNSRSPKAC